MAATVAQPTIKAKYATVYDEPARIAKVNQALPALTPVLAFILTHHGTWLAGTVVQGRPGAHGLRLLFPAGIEGGTSGSPVVTAQGLMMGLVSQAGGTEADALHRGREGYAPRPHLTLPRWLAEQVRAGERDLDQDTP